MQVIIIIIGGGGGGLLLLLVVALIALALIGSGALAALVAALITLLMWLAAILAGCAVAGGVAWYLTRDYRAHKRELADAAQEQRQIEYDRRREQKRIDRQHQRAVEQAEAMAPIAAVVAEAINRGQSSARLPTADEIADALLSRREAYAPPVWRAEVVGSADGKK